MLRLALVSQLACVRAYPSFRDQIPNGYGVAGCDGEAWNGVGHLNPGGGGPRNPFGLDFYAAGTQWTPELCAMDSDGDGKTNGEELGDPSCQWTPGETPQFDTGITHPGVNCGDLVCPDGSARATKSDAPLKGCDKYEYSPTDHAYDVKMTSHIVKPGTSYIKQAFTFPASLPALAVTKFEFVVMEGQVVHHMLLYKCATDVSDEYGTPKEGAKMGCNEVRMAWALGGSDFCMPEDVAILIEPGQHFLLEIHYDNPRNLENVADASGMRIHGVDYVQGGPLKLAAISFVGARNGAISVPPGTDATHMTVTIPASTLGIPGNKSGIIFAHLLHMHLIGRKQWLVATHEPSGEETEVACSTNYDFNLQEFVMPDEPFQLGADTKLTVHCVWDSTSRTEVTRGGEETTDEMCLVAIMYTPYAPKSLMVGPEHVVYSTNGDKVCGCPNTNSTAAASSPSASTRLRGEISMKVAKKHK